MPYRWILLFFLLAAIYGPSLNGPYILDDSHTIATNAIIQSPANWLTAWTSSKAYSSWPATWGYRPLSTFSNLVLWQLGQGAPWPFHVLKLFLFTALCFVLLRIWRELLPGVSGEVLWAGLLLFAVNPVHSQVMGYIAATATLLSALLVAFSVYAYLDFRKTGNRGHLLMSLLAAFLATMAKEEGIVTVALIPCVELCLRRLEGRPPLDKKLLLHFSLYLIPSLLSVALIVLMYEPTTGIARGQVSSFVYFMTQWRAYIRYFVMYFAAYELNADNLEFGFSYAFKDWRVLLALALNGVVVVAAVWQWRRRPQIALALAWFYIGVSPASSVVVLAEPVNDHRAFLGYLGFAMIGVLALNALRNIHRTAFITVCVLLFCAYSGATFWRAKDWGSNERIWRDAAAKNPRSPRAFNNLALELIRQGKASEAVPFLERCKVLGPNYNNCYINLGVAYANLGRDQEAEAELTKSIPLDVTKIQSRLNLAKFLGARGFIKRPIALLTEADGFAQGQDLDVRMELISLYRSSGAIDRAQTIWNESRLVFKGHPRLMDVGRSAGWAQ